MATYLVTAHFNLDRRGASFDGYQSHHPLIRSGYGAFPVEAESVVAAAEATFAVLNLDDRPNGQLEPSLSMGDVLLIVDADGREYWAPCTERWDLLDDAPADIVDYVPWGSWPIVGR